MLKRLRSGTKLKKKKKKNGDDSDSSEASAVSDGGAMWEVRVTTTRFHLQEAIDDLKALAKTACNEEMKQSKIEAAEDAYGAHRIAVEKHEKQNPDSPKNAHNKQTMFGLRHELDTFVSTLHNGGGGAGAVPLQSCVMDPFRMTIPNVTCTSLHMLDSAVHLPFGHATEPSEGPGSALPTHRTERGERTEAASSFYGEPPLQPRGRVSAPGTPLSHVSMVSVGSAGPQVEHPLEPLKMMETCTELQDAGLASLKRSEALTQEMNEQAVAISTELARQAEQEELIAEDLHKLSKQTRRGRRETSAFMRKLASDKCFVCLCIFVLIFFIVALVLKIVDPSSGDGAEADQTLSLVNSTVVVT